MKQSCYPIKFYGSKTIFVLKKIPVIFLFLFLEKIYITKRNKSTNNYI